MVFGLFLFFVLNLSNEIQIVFVLLSSCKIKRLKKMIKHDFQIFTIYINNSENK